MMKKITFLFIMLTVSFGFSQQILIENFDGTEPAFAGFEGLASATIEAAPAGSNGNSLKLVSQASGNPWQGAEVIMQTYKIKLTTDKTAKVDVYSTQAFTLLGKVENGGPASAAAQSYTTPGAWQTLTFTFTQALDGTAAADGEYLKIVFFPNWKADNTGFNVPPGDFTIYVDNITAEATAITPEPAPTTAAPTPPARNAADVYSLFSNAYAARTVENWNASWDSATSSDVVIEGNDTKKVTGFGFLGVEFINNRIDAATFTGFHIDIWTATATLDKSFNLKFSHWGGTSSEVSAIEFSTTNASNPALPNPNPGTWISLDMPLSAWTAGARNDLAQFIITSDLGTVYFDNLYLYKGTPLSNKDFEIAGLNVYPNPTQNSWTVKTQNIKMSTIQVFDILGKQVLSLAPNAIEAKIDASQLKSGLYFAKISTANGSSSLKLVRQ
ncbi:T9SS type A sorting domain-containing protein [Gaetbulibacter aquiaggeris]|uniref:T9SS type A sorting domain-containing protein n=1 Tax=Gaetbulibacter aquiaggeris TaxID=1735373 RepID=A0ABW7MKB0_9FLAO